MVSELSDIMVKDEWFGLFAMKKKMGRQCYVYSFETLTLPIYVNTLTSVYDCLIMHPPPLLWCTAGFMAAVARNNGRVSYPRMVGPLDTVKQGEQSLDRRPNQRRMEHTHFLPDLIPIGIYVSTKDFSSGTGTH